MRGAPGYALALLLSPGFAAGCASTQTLSLECVPSEVTVYVDGRVLAGGPDQIALRKDEPHTFYFKGGGHRTQMVVLESHEVGGELQLTPADLCEQVAFAQVQPELRVEIEGDPAALR